MDCNQARFIEQTNKQTESFINKQNFITCLFYNLKVIDFGYNISLLLKKIVVFT